MTRAEELLDNINEIAPKRRVAVRNKRLVTLVKCPPFFKNVHGACIQDSPQEARQISFRRRMMWRNKIRKVLGKLVTKRRQSLAFRAGALGPQTHVAQKPHQEFLALPKHVRALKALLARRAQQQLTNNPMPTPQGRSVSKGVKGPMLGISTGTTLTSGSASMGGKV